MLAMYALTNGSVYVSVRPDLGGRIDEFIDLKRRKNWVWHPENYSGAPRMLDIGSSFDESWQGGWDDVFPNDAAADFHGRRLADHGELWSQNWEVIKYTSDRIDLSYQCKTVPVYARKAIRIQATESVVEVEYSFENQSDDAIPFLFKLHPALKVLPGDEIVLPRCSLRPVALEFSSLIGVDEKTAFPAAISKVGTTVVVNKVLPASSGTREFFYCMDLSQGWCGIRSVSSRGALKFEFSRDAFPYVWVFQSYGGWHGHHVVMLEPATTMPYDLEQACRQGTCAILKPRERRRVEIVVRTMDVDEDA